MFVNLLFLIALFQVWRCKICIIQKVWICHKWMAYFAVSTRAKKLFSQLYQDKGKKNPDLRVYNIVIPFEMRKRFFCNYFIANIKIFFKMVQTG